MRDPIRHQHAKARLDEKGFTLVELLVVIVILAILASIVVFAVGTISNRGQAAACDADRKGVQTAEESYYAQNSTYASEFDLVPRYLHEQSGLWDVVLSGSGSSTSYTVSLQDPDGAGPQTTADNVCAP